MEPSGPLPPELTAQLEVLAHQRDTGEISDIAFNIRRSILLDQWEAAQRRALRDGAGRARQMTRDGGGTGRDAASAEPETAGVQSATWPPGGSTVGPIPQSSPPDGPRPGWRLPDESPPNGWAYQSWNQGPVPGVSYGGFWIRAVAALIDGVILYVPFAVVFFLVIALAIRGRSGPGLDTLVALLVGYVIVAIAYGIVFISTMGATPGMRVLNLRVVRAADGGRCGLGRAIVRGLSSAAFSLLTRYLIGLFDPLWVAWDSRKQALHDKVAETVVIRSWNVSQGLLSPDGRHRWDGVTWRPV